MLDPKRAEELRQLERDIRAELATLGSTWGEIVRDYVVSKKEELQRVLAKYPNFSFSIKTRAPGDSYALVDACTFVAVVGSEKESLTIYDSQIRTIKDLFFLVGNIEKQLKSLAVFELEMNGGLDEIGIRLFQENI